MVNPSLEFAIKAIRDDTRDICIKVIESLIEDPQGFEIDEPTVLACVSILRSLSPKDSPNG